jgi:hypothetical protein
MHLLIFIDFSNYPGIRTYYALLDVKSNGKKISSRVLDPEDPYVFGPPGSGSFHEQAKQMKKNLDFYCFVTCI